MSHTSPAWHDALAGPDFRISHLRAFVAFVAEGGISAGARRLGLGQPTLTRAIRRLEWSLGTSVLARGPGGLELTDFGRVLLPHARRLMRAHERTEQTASQLAGASHGSVTAAASALPRALLLPRATRAMWGRFPGIRLAVRDTTYPNVLGLFDGALLDFAMCPLPASPLPAQLESRPLLAVGLGITLRSGHPLQRARRLADFVGCEWIAAGPPSGQGMREAFDGAGLEVPACRVHCESLEHAMRLVASSDRVMLAPAPVVSCLAAGAGLVQPPLDDPLPALSIGLIVPVRHALSPAAQVLLDGIVDCARATPGGARR